MPKPIACLFALVSVALPAFGQTLPGQELIERLRQGGYVILMRHASSPMAVPDKASAEPDNTGPERQLDAEGKASAAAMGRALKALRIPIGQVLSSPTYRALETVRLAELPSPETAPELGDKGQPMQAVGAGPGAWLRQMVGLAPRTGTDTLLITHLPNIRAAYPQESAGLADGESLVFQPDGRGGARLIGRITIESWPALAKKMAP